MQKLFERFFFSFFFFLIFRFYILILYSDLLSTPEVRLVQRWEARKKTVPRLAYDQQGHVFEQLLLHGVLNGEKVPLSWQNFANFGADVLDADFLLVVLKQTVVNAVVAQVDLEAAIRRQHLVKLLISALFVCVRIVYFFTVEPQSYGCSLAPRIETKAIIKELKYQLVPLVI